LEQFNDLHLICGRHPFHNTSLPQSPAAFLHLVTTAVTRC